MPTLLLTTGIDTTILSTQTGNNFGISPSIAAGRSSAGSQIRRSMVRPDIAALLAIPGATITSAILRLWCTVQLSPTGLDVMAHLALTEWYEGNQNGGSLPAGIDGSTWARRNGNPSNLINWTGGSGGGAGSDYATVASDTVSVDNINTFFNWDVTTDILAAYAAGGVGYYGWWLKQPALNEGTNGTNKTFASYQFASSTEWPLLTVEYTVGGGLLPVLMQYGQYSGGTL